MKYLSIKTLFKLFLVRVSLCFEPFCGIVKLICEFRHKFFINLRLRQKNNLRPSALFLRNLRSVAGKLTHSGACGNTYSYFSRFFISFQNNCFFQNETPLQILFRFCFEVNGPYSQVTTTSMDLLGLVLIKFSNLIGVI